MLFEAEKKIIASAIGDHVEDIQHVGSTAVPGMRAKPILDIAIAVEEFEAARVCIEPLISLGYTFKGENGIPRRHYFQKGEPCTHHIHMVEEVSEEWERLILFRDILQANSSVTGQYLEFKVDLWKNHDADRKFYQAAKTDFIEGVIRRVKGTLQD